ncbi:NUDIX domain-containing protein [Candidatus Dojkabacteria bacterium]|nr:NUDIX domain-containing protein [Candidatus Dojkabacteria bacterium]
MKIMEDSFHLGIKALILNQENELLLLKVNKELLRGSKNDSYWDIPGGRIQKGDTIESTIKREVKEETGLEIKEIQFYDMAISNIRIPVGDTDVGLILAVYTCKCINNKERIKLSREHVDFGFFNITQSSKLLQVKYPKNFTKKVENLHNFFEQKN